MHSIDHPTQPEHLPGLVALLASQAAKQPPATLADGRAYRSADSGLQGGATDGCEATGHGEPPALGAADDVLFDKNPLPLWIYELETFKVVAVNPAAIAKYGYSREEFLNLRLGDLRESRDAAWVESLIRGLAPNTPIRALWRHKLKSGEVIDVEINSDEIVYRGRRARLVCPVDVTQRVHAEAALRERESALQRAQVLARLAHVVTLPDGRFESWSETFPELIGVDPARIPTDVRGWIDLLHPDDRPVFRERSIAAARSGQRVDMICRLPHADAGWRHIRQVLEPIRAADGSGRVERWFNTLLDISEHARSELRVRRLNRVHEVLSGINSLIVRVRNRQELFQEACRIAVNAGAFNTAWIGQIDAISGHGRVVAAAGIDEAVTRSDRLTARHCLLDTQGPALRAIGQKAPVIFNDLAQDIGRSELGDVLLAQGHKSAAWLPLFCDGAAVGVINLLSAEVGVFDDDELKLLLQLADDISFALDHLAKEERLSYLASYDALTGLANNTLLQERLQQFIGQAAAEQQPLAVAVIDIERFKLVNDTLGRRAGDALLKQVGGRLAESVHDGRRIARVGVDQFALVLTGANSETDIVRMLGEHHAHCFDQTFRIEGQDLHVAARIGIAVYPNDGLDFESLYRHAEVAVKKAKSGPDKLLFFNPRMTEAVAERLALENKLRRALDNNEFVLHYQPKVEMGTRRILALEALIRWNSPELGLVPPGRFIPLMEETGLILDVGQWALKQAALDRKRWLDSGLPAPRIAVNVSAIQLRRPDFVETVASALQHGAADHGIDVEITESMIMEDIDGTVHKLHGLRALAMDLSIDDFGTGYSSLAYLAKLPAQTLKIDRAFVNTLVGDASSRTLVSTMISLAHALKMTVVAEGVETEEQAATLLEMKCDQIQGYLISRPLAFDAITRLIAEATPVA